MLLLVEIVQAVEVRIRVMIVDPDYDMELDNPQSIIVMI